MRQLPPHYVVSNKMGEASADFVWAFSKYRPVLVALLRFNYISDFLEKFMGFLSVKVQAMLNHEVGRLWIVVDVLRRGVSQPRIDPH